MKLFKTILFATMVVASVAQADVAYQVEAGNTFYGIANKFGIANNALKKANPGIDIEYLQEGQIIVLPISETRAKQRLQRPQPVQTVKQIPIVNKKGVYTVYRDDGSTFQVDNSSVKIIPVNTTKPTTVPVNKSYQYTTPTGRTSIIVVEQ